MYSNFQTARIIDDNQTSTLPGTFCHIIFIAELLVVAMACVGLLTYFVQRVSFLLCRVRKYLLLNVTVLKMVFSK